VPPPSPSPPLPLLPFDADTAANGSSSSGSSPPPPRAPVLSDAAVAEAGTRAGRRGPGRGPGRGSRMAQSFDGMSGVDGAPAGGGDDDSDGEGAVTGSEAGSPWAGRAGASESPGGGEGWAAAETAGWEGGGERPEEREEYLRCQRQVRLFLQCKAEVCLRCTVYSESYNVQCTM
jgi:hypothetical protein